MANFLIYNTDNNRLEHHDGNDWQTNETAEDVDGKLNSYVKADGSVPISNLEVTNNLIVGGSIQDASAIVQADSTTQGLLPPRMSETQRDLITAAEGLLIYNLTTKRYNFNDGTGWIVLSAGASLIPYAGYVGGHATYILDGNSDTSSLNLLSLTDNVWTTVGPTSSGASVIWPDLDIIPSTAVGIIVRHKIQASGTTISEQYSVSLKARPAGSVATGISTERSESAVFNPDGNLHITRSTVEVTAAIDSSKIFELFHERIGAGGSYVSTLLLAGWIDSL